MLKNAACLKDKRGLDPCGDDSRFQHGLHRRHRRQRRPSRLQSNLNANVIDVQWVVEAYALFSQRCCDWWLTGRHFGRKRIYISAVSVLHCFDLCGLAPNINQLIIARAAQGVGGALLVPGSLAIISSSFKEEERGRAIGTWSGFTAITAAVGPVLGGWLIEKVSWRAVFFINVPFAIIVLGLVFLHVPESRDEESLGLDGLEQSGNYRSRRCGIWFN